MILKIQAGNDFFPSVSVLANCIKISALAKKKSSEKKWNISTVICLLIKKIKR